jgi:hypothetical protein
MTKIDDANDESEFLAITEAADSRGRKAAT